MDNQSQRFRLEQDARSGKESGGSSSENQQRSGTGNENRNVGTTEGQQPDQGAARSPEQTGGPQEGNIDKPRRKPLVNKGFD